MWEEKPSIAGNWFYRDSKDSPGQFTLIIVDDISTSPKGLYYGPIDIYSLYEKTLQEFEMEIHLHKV